ncbi:MAG TPA: inverse autotransporter beta domain-containing protein [Planctomycetaceae bacterium]|nr:inverse autotransporter beta domain-containing protein [Planctomycetaceae bacterium]
MQWSHPRRKVACLPFGWRCVWVGLAVCLAIWPSLGLGQDADPSRSALEDSIFYDDRVTGQSGQALGALWRVGYLTGPALGRQDGIAPVEVMPYFFLEDGMFFGDARGFRSDRDGWGANVGLGYRHYVRQWDRIFGANAYYDYDNTSGTLFRQFGFGLETLGSQWDSRLNAYFPVSNEQALLSRRFLQSSIRFAGNQILYDQILTFGTQMRGLDHEVGVPLPGRFSVNHDVRMVAGWYHFDGPRVPNTTGWKGRLQGELTPNVAMALEVTNDAVFDTNVVFSVALQYGGFREDTNRPKTQFSRMTTPVQRQYTAVVSRTDVLETGIVARKPDGTPYLVEHVANNPADPNLGPYLGTAENPFLTIAQAQANFFTDPPFEVPVSPYAGDIIFVHTNSQYTNTNIVLEPNVRVLGEADGVVHQINLPPFGLVNLPRVNDNPSPAVAELRPLFENIVGDGVVLASGAEFSGFRIGDAADPTSGPTGNGIVGDSINNTLVRLVDINYAGADGVLLTNVNTVAFDQTHIFNAAGIGLHVVGGSPNITFEGDGDATTADIEYNLATPGGNAVQIDSTLGGLVDLFAATPSVIDYDNAGGIFVNNARGSASFGDVRISNTTLGVDGIQILASGGVYTFGRPVLMDNPDGRGIHILDMTTTGRAIFNDSVTINNRSVEGVLLDSNIGDVRFNNTLSIVSGAGAPFEAALSYQSSSGDATFQNISLVGGQVQTITPPIPPARVPGTGIGISIGNDTVGVANNTGTFTVTGITSITDFSGISLDIRDDDANVSFGTLAINDRGHTGISIVDSTGNIAFRGITSVANTTDVLNNATAASTDTAVVIDNNTGDISFGTLTVTGALGSFTNNIAGVSITDNPSQITIQQLNIQSVFGEALFAFNVGDRTADPLTGGLFVNSGTLDSTFESAINVEESVVSMNFTTVNVVQSADEGIRMSNNTAGGNGVALSIDPGTDIIGNGGRIVQSTNQGILAENTGPIAIRAMDFVQNGIGGNVDGIFVQNNLAALQDVRTATTLTVQSSSIVQSGGAGVHTLNAPFVSIVNTRFLQNDGTGGSPEILIESGLILPDGDDVDTFADPYIVRLDTLNVTENRTNAIRVATLPLGFGSALDLELTNSTVFLNPVGVIGPAAVDIDWSGPESLFIDNNQITFLTDLAEGIFITNNFTNDLDPNTPDLSVVTVTDNVLQGPDDFNVGMVVNMQGPSSVLIARNTFTLGGFADDAILFTYGANTNTNLEDNVVDAAGDQSRGFVFQSISAPALVTMNGNTLTFLDNDGFLDERGIEFLSTIGTINFNGTVNNIVTIDNLNGIGFPWFIFPVNGSANGSVIINSSPQP